MKRVTSQTIKDLYEFVTKKYGTRVKYKPNAWEAKVIAYLLDTTTILDYDTFMKNYAFVLGKTIYTPFRVGDNTDFSYNNQIKTLGHEHTHILHANKVGRVRWNWRYAKSQGFRMEAEVKAYVCTMELNHFLTGKVSNPEVYASLLFDYGMGKDDVEIALFAFRKANTMIGRGFYQSKLTKLIRTWLR